MLNQFFNSQTKTITFAAILLGFSTLFSRILGLIRDRLLAGTFGAGPELDIYFASFQIPDFIYGILILGGLGVVFLPLFSEYYERNSKEGWQFANQVFNCFLILLILICGFLVIFTPWIMKIIVPGFSEDQKDTTVALTRIMLFAPILFGLSSIFSGILHYFNRFLVYSFCPILYNLGIIFGILILVPIFGLFGLAYGVIFGAFLHWIIQIPAAKSLGFLWQPLFNFKFPGLIKVFKLMIPRAIARAAYHINLIVITAIASTLVSGSIAIFNFANNLQYFPVGIIGISFAIASFPALSKAWSKKDLQKFLEDFSLTFRQILFLIIPTIFLVFLLRAQIVRIILGTGQFGWWETRLTAASLGIFCLGILGAAFVPFLARVFFSFQDTKTPAAIGIISMILNIILCFSLVKLLSFPNIFQEGLVSFLKLKSLKGIEIIGLPLALSISTVFQFFLLLLSLYKKLGQIKLREILNSFKKIFLASIFMAISIYFSLQLISNLVNMKTFLGVFTQAFLAAVIGILVYIFITYRLKSPEIKIIWLSMLKQFKKV